MSNLVLLHGADSFRLKQRRDFYQKAFSQKFPDGEVEVFDGKTEFNRLQNAVLTPSLFTSKRLVFTEDFWTPESFEQAEKSKFFTTLENLHDTVTLICIESSLDKRTKGAKYLLKNADAKEFDPLPEPDILRWIQTTVEHAGGNIAPSDSQFLLRRVGPDLWRLHQELQKCLTFSLTNDITSGMIEKLTIPHPQTVIWDFLACLSRQQKPQAFEHLKQLRQSGETPHMIFSMIAREIRIHLQLLSGLQSGLEAKELAKKFAIHPYVVSKTLPLTQKFTLAKLKTFYERLISIDHRLKTGKIMVTAQDQSEFDLQLEKLIITM